MSKLKRDIALPLLPRTDEFPEQQRFNRDIAKVVADVAKDAYSDINSTLMGPQGPKGDQGANGTNGTNGLDGNDGADGADGAPGPKGDSGVALVIGTTTVGSSQYKYVDTVAVSNSKVQKWIVSAYTDTEYIAFEVLALIDGSSVSYNCYGIIGDDASIALDVVSDGTDVKLKITNNEASTLYVSYKRISLGVESGENTIATSELGIIDVVGVTEYPVHKWIMSVSTTADIEVFEVIALVKDTDVYHTMYGIMGDSIDFILALTSDGTNLSLSITNNEAVNIAITFKRI